MHCNECSRMMWGPAKTGLKCMDCGYVCHEKCLDSIPKICIKHKSKTQYPGYNTLRKNSLEEPSVDSSNLFKFNFAK